LRNWWLTWDCRLAMETPNPDLQHLLVSVLAKSAALDARLKVLEDRVKVLEDVTVNHDNRLSDLEADENDDYYPTR
jgi:vacuolar-type H+-ATPase subunit E/Vma4